MNRTIKTSLSAAVAAFMTIASSSAQLVYDLQDTLAAAQPTVPNPTGVFSFGHYTAGVDPTTFTLYTIFDESILSTGADAFYTNPFDPNVIYNDTGAIFNNFGIVLAPGELSLGPSLGPTVVRFIAPAAGDYQISARFLEVQGDDPATAYVYRNITQLSTGTADYTGFNYSDTLTLAAGDSIDFIVGVSGLYGSATSLAATLTVVPEPSTVYLLLGIGVPLLFLSRRLKRTV